MTAEATSADAARHRVLEGVLLRLAGRADAAELVLRGGMLLRHWFRPTPRLALDLDLVAPHPLTPAEARRYLPLFADATVADGVVFDLDRLHIEGIWQHTDNPGVRVYACDVVGGNEVDAQIDITGGPPPRPAPVLGELPTACGRVARVWVCRPESVAAQKVQALYQMGVLRWRPKDLNDLSLLLARVPLVPADLRGAMGAYLADVGGTPDDALALFGPTAWWGMKLSTARWLDFAAAGDPGVPRELSGVVAEVAGRLASGLEGK
ncbi:MAG: nucleotidyl transferase AbiEii/AbiGii toxin family protein [Rhodospirillales bacterium]|nr:nucleotidyl transferase AbiEii/AbiGii toxin family protein [Rhodospirillales bacterium]